VFYYTSVKSNFNSKFFANSSISVFNDTDGTSRMNTSFVFKEEFARTVGFITTKIKMLEDDKDYQRDVMKKTLDYCSLSEGLFGNFLARKFMDLVANYSNVPLSCPVKAGSYYGTNVPVLNIDAPFIFRDGLQWEFAVTFKGKKTNSSRLLQLFSWTFQGTYLKKKDLVDFIKKQ